jgi:hypothetical protein
MRLTVVDEPAGVVALTDLLQVHDVELILHPALVRLRGDDDVELGFPKRGRRNLDPG